MIPITAYIERIHFSGSARLVGGRNSLEGRVEVYKNYSWGTVCDNGFTDAAARVVCFMLGYGYVVVANTYIHI